MSDASAPPISLGAAINLKPLRTGELLDLTFHLYRRYFLQLFLIAAIIYGFNFVLSIALEQVQSGIPKQELFKHPDVLVKILVIGGISLFVFEIGAAALTLFISEIYFGRVPPIRECLAALPARLPALIYTQVLRIVILVAVFSLPVFPLVAMVFLVNTIGFVGIIGLLLLSLLLLTPGLVLAVRYLLCVQVVMLEKKQGWAALRRSSEIASYDPGLGFWYWGATRLSLLLFVLMLVSLLVSATSAAPFLTSDGADMLRGVVTDRTFTSSPATIATHIMNYLGSALVAPLYVLSVVLFYYDIRIRREGLDLQVMAASLTPPPPHSP